MTHQHQLDALLAEARAADQQIADEVDRLVAEHDCALAAELARRLTPPAAAVLDPEPDDDCDPELLALIEGEPKGRFMPVSGSLT